MKIIVVLSLIAIFLSPISNTETAAASGDRLVIASFSGSVGSLAGYKIGDAA